MVVGETLGISRQRSACEQSLQEVRTGTEEVMAEMYNHHTVEKKWQKVWDDEKAFHTPNDYTKPKFYALVEFPYPSGQGLHVGHPRPYTLSLIHI